MIKVNWNKIKQVRKELEYTLAELSDISWLSPRWIFNLEKGWVVAKEETLDKLVKWFNKPRLYKMTDNNNQYIILDKKYKKSYFLN